MRLSAAVFFAATLFAATETTCADDVSRDLACRFRHAVIEADSFNALPGPIADFLRPKLGEMAKRGAFFNATDVIERPGPSRRFIRAGHSGDVWFLWYEHGGIAYNRNLVVLNWKRGDAQPHLIVHAFYSSSTACVQTDAILDGHLPSQPASQDWW